jgi:pectinesterase
MCTVEVVPGVDLDGVETYLGRPYRNISHVAFIKKSLSHMASPNGWVAWNMNKVVEDTTRTVLYLEYGNDSAVANTSSHIKWLGFRVLNAATEAATYTADTFINVSKWVPEPIQYDHNLRSVCLI